MHCTNNAAHKVSFQYAVQSSSLPSSRDAFSPVLLNEGVYSAGAAALAERFVSNDASFFSPGLTSPCSVGQD